MIDKINYQIIDALNASVYWKDINGKYLGCNDYMAKMAGLSREQIIGNTDYYLPWKDQANKIREIDLLVINSCKKYEIEETALTSDYLTRVFLSSKSPLFDENDKVIGVIGVSIDITHYKKFETEFSKTESELERCAGLESRLLKNINHEVRVPLSSIMNMSEILEDNWSTLDEKTKYENIKQIFDEIRRLSNFIINAYDVSKFLKNQVILKLEKANFSSVLRNIIKKYHRRFCDTKVNIEISPFDDYYFAFDHDLICRVVENLLMNAIQYSPKKKKITVSLYKSFLKNTEIPAVTCCISDEGIGIPENEIEAVFNPFTESTRTISNARGIGLGLSAAKQIIEAHHGHIWIENNLLKLGITVNFTIPTTLLSLHENAITIEHNNIFEVNGENNNILRKNLSIKSYTNNKEHFALVGVSPFNSYFSIEKILEICEWVHNEYSDFAIFVPDEISRYTFEALGYTESRIGRKIKKQDNYTINKITRALDCFYQKHLTKTEIKVYTLSTLKENSAYKDLYHLYSSMFLDDKEFRQGCLEVTEWVLLNNNSKEVEIEEAQKNVAAQYFLLELPVMTNMVDILKLKSCDFIYHNIPKFLKHLYFNREFVSDKQKLLILN